MTLKMGGNWLIKLSRAQVKVVNIAVIVVGVRRLRRDHARRSEDGSGASWCWETLVRVEAEIPETDKTASGASSEHFERVR